MQHERKTKINTVQKQHGALADDGIQGALAPGPEWRDSVQTPGLSWLYQGDFALNSLNMLNPVLWESLGGFSAEC